MSLHSTPIRVRFSDLDPYHHVNHSVYLSYFEVGRSSLLDSKNITLFELQQAGFQMVVSEISVKYLAPATAGLSISVESEIVKRRKVSTIWSQRLVGNGVLLATASVTIVTTNLEGKVARLPKPLAEILL